MSEQDDLPPVQDVLTPTQWEMVKLLPLGQTDKEIGRAFSTSRGVIVGHLSKAAKRLAPYAHDMDVLSLTRTGLAVICVRANKCFEAPPRLCGWAMDMWRALTPLEQKTLKLLAQDVSLDQITRTIEPMSSDPRAYLRTIGSKLAPYMSYARVGRLDRDGMAMMFVRSRVHHGAWCQSARRQLTETERRVAVLAATGLQNQEIGPILRIQRSTVKTHMEHSMKKLAPYASVLGATRPASRSALAMVVVVAHLDKEQ